MQLNYYAQYYAHAWKYLFIILAWSMNNSQLLLDYIVDRFQLLLRYKYLIIYN